MVDHDDILFCFLYVCLVPLECCLLKGRGHVHAETVWMECVFASVEKKRILGQARQTFWLTREQRCQEQNGREFANIDHDTMYSSKPLRLYPLADVWRGVHRHKLRVTGHLQHPTCVRVTTLCQMIHGARYCRVFVRAQLLWRLSKSPRADLCCKNGIIDGLCTTKQLHW